MDDKDDEWTCVFYIHNCQRILFQYGKWMMNMRMAGGSPQHEYIDMNE